MYLFLKVSRRLGVAIGFVGDFMSGDTPDPIRGGLSI